MASSILRKRDDVRYFGVALGLKLLGSTALSRRLYRRLGNRFGQRRHGTVTTVDVQRGLWLCDVVRRTRLADRPLHALELGTGWTHFYGLFLRLFFDARIVAFDVQDNRQFGAVKRRFGRLLPLLDAAVTDAGALRRAHTVGAEIESASSFDDLYGRLGVEYMIEQNGRLDQLPSGSFDLVFSFDVLEHIPREALDTAVTATARLLRSGGVSAHQIGLDDHLNHYVTASPDKQYIRYNNRTWRWFFENRLQYFNRVQMPDFVEAFSKAGLELIYESAESDPDLLQRISPSADFRRYDERALQAVRGFLVHRKSG